MQDNMISINEIEKDIINHFSHLSFCVDKSFYWSASLREVHYKSATSVEDIWQLLHEIAHAKLGHHNYTKDIQLLNQEVAAWYLAKKQLAPLFNVNMDEDFAEDQLDSYRNWLHERSKCPQCTQTGIQQTTSIYQCINCSCSWSVNDARLCKLRRIIKLQDQNRSDQQVFVA